MIKERYAFYSASFPSPNGNVVKCFHVDDYSDPPTIDGVDIPEKDYEARAVLELDFSVCDPSAATAILCKFFLFLFLFLLLLFDFILGQNSIGNAPWLNFVPNWSFALGSLWYAYKRLRDLERSRYPRVDLPQPALRRTDDRIDPWTLRRIRMGSDNPARNGYSCDTLGREDHVQEWIDYGLSQHIYDHNWLDELDQILLFTRAEANEAILTFYN